LVSNWNSAAASAGNGGSARAAALSRPDAKLRRA
jgi:hypothetical protein